MSEMDLALHDQPSLIGDGWHHPQDTLGLVLSHISVHVSIGGDMPNRRQKEDLFLLIRGKIILSPNIKLMHM